MVSAHCTMVFEAYPKGLVIGFFRIVIGSFGSNGIHYFPKIITTLLICIEDDAVKGRSVD